VPTRTFLMGKEKDERSVRVDLFFEKVDASKTHSSSFSLSSLAVNQPKEVLQITTLPSHLLAILTAPSKKAIVIVLEEFDLFAGFGRGGRQMLLYCLREFLPFPPSRISIRTFFSLSLDMLSTI